MEYFLHILDPGTRWDFLDLGPGSANKSGALLALAIVGSVWFGLAFRWGWWVTGAWLIPLGLGLLATGSRGGVLAALAGLLAVGFAAGWFRGVAGVGRRLGLGVACREPVERSKRREGDGADGRGVNPLATGGGWSSGEWGFGYCMWELEDGCWGCCGRGVRVSGVVGLLPRPTGIAVLWVALRRKRKLPAPRMGRAGR